MLGETSDMALLLTFCLRQIVTSAEQREETFKAVSASGAA